MMLAKDVWNDGGAFSPLKNGPSHEQNNAILPVKSATGSCEFSRKFYTLYYTFQ
jgi:hypothetical protein